MRRLLRSLRFAAVLLAALAPPAGAQPDLRVAADVSLLADDSGSYAFSAFDMARDVNGDGDEAPRYRIYLAVPRKAPPRAGHPVVYLLDGNAVLDLLGRRRALLRPAGDSATPPVLVMIAYETPARFEVKARAYDYTPPVPTIPGEPLLEDRPGSGRRAGGAEVFRDFIARRLKPEIEARLRAGERHIDPSRQGLWGHSYGGLFVLYVLFTYPGDFQEYYAVSPSLDWRDGWIRRLAENASPASGTVTLLALSGADEAGEKRKRNRPARPETEDARPARAAGESVRDLAARLDARHGYRARAILMEGKSHGEMFAVGLEAALRDQRTETRGQRTEDRGQRTVITAATSAGGNELDCRVARATRHDGFRGPRTEDSNSCGGKAAGN